MKFTIDGTEFKNLVTKISNTAMKGSYNHIYEYIRISANNSGVSFQAENDGNFATITVYETVYECGETWVDLADLKKTINITGELTITAEDGRFEVRSSKKCYEIVACDLSENWIAFPSTDDFNDICDLDKVQFIDYLSKLDCMRESSDHNEMLNSFYLDFINEKIVVLDGHRIGIAKITDANYSDDCKSIVVNGKFYKCLKGLSGKSKTNDRVIVTAGKKYARFECKESNYCYWSLISWIPEGKYYDYGNMFFSYSDYVFECDNKELGNIAKEYGKMNGVKDMKPMIICSENERIATGFCNARYRTSDVLENVTVKSGMSQGWYSAYNPAFIADACNIIDGKIDVSGYYEPRKPVIFSDDTFTILMLPVNISGEADIEFVRKQIA